MTDHGKSKSQNAKSSVNVPPTVHTTTITPSVSTFFYGIFIDLIVPIITDKIHVCYFPQTAATPLFLVGVTFEGQRATSRNKRTGNRRQK